MMLVMAYGQTDEGEDVMVPLLDVQLYPINPNQDDGPSSDDADDLDETPVFTSVLTLENTAFLLNDMAGDVGRAVDLLAAQCGGSVKPDPERMRYSAQVLRKAASRLQATAELLDSRCIQDTHD